MIISSCIDLVKDLIGRDEGIGNIQADIVLTPVLLIGIRNSGHGHPSSVFFIVDATSQEIIGGQKITAGWERDGTRIIYRIQARMEARAQWHWKTSRALAILLHTPVFLLWPGPCMVMPTGRGGGRLHTLCPRFGQCPIPSLLSLFLLLLALHCGQFLWRSPPTPHCGKRVILTIPLNPPSSSWRKVLVTCISTLQMKKVEAQRDDLICPRSRHWQWTSGLSESKGQASPLIPTCLALLGPQPDS